MTIFSFADEQTEKVHPCGKVSKWEQFIGKRTGKRPYGSG